MKIDKVKSREYKGKTYYKYRIQLPTKIVKDAGLKGGEDFDVIYKKGEIVLKKKQ